MLQRQMLLTGCEGFTVRGVRGAFLNIRLTAPCIDAIYHKLTERLICHSAYVVFLNNNSTQYLSKFLVKI